MSRVRPQVTYLVLSLGLTACASLVPGPTAGLSGSVTFPVQRRTQATTADVASAATVSLIDPTYNRTVATTLTNPDGSYSLTLSHFVPQVRTYYLEALKGLSQNQAGHDAPRLRTLVRWDGATWRALTTTDASIGFATTALSAITALRNLTPNLLIETLAPSGSPYGYTFNGGTDLGFSQDNLPQTLTQSEFSTVEGLVAQALGQDRDPLDSLRYQGSAYTLTPPTSAPFVYFALPDPASEGDEVTLTGGNFVAGTGSTVRLNGLVAPIVAGDAETLRVLVPNGATSGLLTVATPNGTASCPLRITPRVGGGMSDGPVPTPIPATGSDLSGNLLGNYRLWRGRP